MPHTCNAWGIGTEYANTPIHIQEMSAVRCPTVFENFHIFLQGLRKHFLYVRQGYKLPRHNKIKKNFRNEQHPNGTLYKKDAINRLHHYTNQMIFILCILTDSQDRLLS